jgi:hypothetical protein
MNSNFKILNDDSPRTVRFKRAGVMMRIAIICILLGIILYIRGIGKYKNVVKNSSSPIGTILNFERSEANIEITDIYTDKTESCLIVRFRYDDFSANRLPYKGSDYKVFIHSPALDEKVKEMPIIFGKMSTNGDAFLVIPKPNDAVYSVFIMNTKYLNVSKNTDSKNTDNYAKVDDEEDIVSLSKSLSNYKYNPKNSKKQSYKIDGNKKDIVSFRLTKNPMIKSKEYLPKVLDATLIKEDGKFDFETFFNILFKDNVTKDLEVEFEKVEQNVTQLKSVLKENELRLKENPKDANTKKEIENLKTKLKEAEQKKSQITEKLYGYYGLQYSDKLFSNLQTKARVFKLKK